MSWQLFVVIQTAIFSLAAISGLWLHVMRLRRHNDELTRLCLAAHDELVNVTAKLRDIETTAPPEKMLEQRIKGVSGDDPIDRVRRLVLENEIRKVPDFEQRLVEHLAPDEPEEQEFVTRWKSIRAECQQLAMFLVADNPAAHPALTQIFEVIQPLDELYGVHVDALQEPGEASAQAAPAAPAARSPDAGAGESGGEMSQDELDALLASAQSCAGGESSETARNAS